MFDRSSPKVSKSKLRLRILATTDLHCHILSYDYTANRPVEDRGLERIAALLTGLRQEQGLHLLLDNGDFLIGSPVSDYAAEFGSGDKEHPMVKAMNLLGFDAATIGNHEFNYGLDYLQQALSGAQFPVVSSNILRFRGPTVEDDQPLFPPGCILEREAVDEAGRTHAVKIGIIGFSPPQIERWDRRHLAGKVQTRDIVEAARVHVPELRRRGADIVIALAHSGPGEPNPAAGSENASLALSLVEGIDAIIGGHSHQLFPSAELQGLDGVDCVAGTFHGKPAIICGAFGSHLGRIDLELTRSGHGGWQITAHETALHPVAANDPGSPAGSADPKTPEPFPCATLSKHFSQVHGRTLDYIRQPVGRCTGPISTYFSLVGDCSAIEMVCKAKVAHVRSALAGGPFADLPILASCAPYNAGGMGGPDNYLHIPPGDIRNSHLAEIYPFPNVLRALRVTGAQLRAWLERAAGIYNQLALGERDQKLLDPRCPSYDFEVVYGLTYRIDPSQPRRYDPEGGLVNPQASRIRDIRHEGRPLRDNATFVLVTNNFRLDGGTYPVTDASDVVFSCDTPKRELLRRYLARTEVVADRPVEIWRFEPLPGTAALFDTSPQALTRVAPPAHLDLRATGEMHRGFQRMRLFL